MPLLIESIKRVGKLDSMCDGKEFIEKGAQLAKNKFASKKRKFTGNLIENCIVIKCSNT